MITTELSNIQGLISSNAKLSTGMDFLRLIRSEGLLEASNGFFPAIMGGAVRDGIFLNREINDIDIFLFRDSRALPNGLGTTVRNVATQIEDIRQNFLAWLEDMEIEHQSLLSDRASAYFGANQFIDIIQFVWNEVTIQVMIPTANSICNTLDNLLRTMPIFSGVALTLDCLRMFDATLASYFLPENQYFIATDRDIPYLRNKAPNGLMIPVAHAREAVALALHSFIQPVALDAVDTNMSSSTATNSSAKLILRAFVQKTGVSAERVNQSTNLPIATN